MTTKLSEATKEVGEVEKRVVEVQNELTKKVLVEPNCNGMVVSLYGHMMAKGGGGVK